MKTGDFLILVEFADGGVVTLLNGDQLSVEPSEGNNSVTLDDAKLGLIKRLQAVQNEETA